MPTTRQSAAVESHPRRAAGQGETRRVSWMEANTPQGMPSGDWDFWSQGLDPAFFSRVYTRSTQIGMVAILLFLAFEQRGLALGLFSGLATGLFTLWTAEVTVRLLFKGGQHAGFKLAIGALVKMPFMLTGLVAIAGAAYHGHMNIFGVLGGVLLHADDGDCNLNGPPGQEPREIPVI